MGGVLGWWKPRIAGACIYLFAAHCATSATIVYETQSLGGNRWEYSYTVTNNSLGAPLEQFTIYFDRAIFSNLAVTATPPDWDSLVVQPDPELPADGFFDSLAVGSGLPIGGGINGFAVSFDFSGPGEPAEQIFEVVDPDTFEVLESGSTPAVPAPPAGIAMITALLAVAGRLRRRGATRAQT